MERPTFWVLYDFGQGGLWAVICADSADQIRARYPQLTVFNAAPDFLDPQTIELVLRADVQDVENPRSGWVRDLVPTDAAG